MEDGNPDGVRRGSRDGEAHAGGRAAGRQGGPGRTAEIAACRPWLDREIELVGPKVIVCLGATAAQALLGRTFRVTKQRGELFPQPAGYVITATLHPSSILRTPDPATRQAEMAALTDDLRLAARQLQETSA